MAESTDTAVKEKDEISSEAVSVDTDGFGGSAMTDEVVLDEKPSNAVHDPLGHCEGG